MTTSVRIEVLLTPVMFDRTPTGRIGIDTLKDFVLDTPTWFTFNCEGTHVQLTVEQYGKTIRDTRGDLDTAIIISEVKLNGITDPKFAWSGIYRPDYPDYYLSQNPNLKTELSAHNYLGWNGSWTLDLSLPIYTWIHKTLDLGWIYD
jgi:hypothetical protein